jgi:hypothetical protein
MKQMAVVLTLGLAAILAGSMYHHVPVTPKPKTQQEDTLKADTTKDLSYEFIHMNRFFEYTLEYDKREVLYLDMTEASYELGFPETTALVVGFIEKYKSLEDSLMNPVTEVNVIVDKEAQTAITKKIKAEGFVDVRFLTPDKSGIPKEERLQRYHAKTPDWVKHAIEMWKYGA